MRTEHEGLEEASTRTQSSAEEGESKTLRKTQRPPPTSLSETPPFVNNVWPRAHFLTAPLCAPNSGQQSCPQGYNGEGVTSALCLLLLPSPCLGAQPTLTLRFQ